MTDKGQNETQDDAVLVKGQVNEHVGRIIRALARERAVEQGQNDEFGNRLVSGESERCDLNRFVAPRSEAVCRPRPRKTSAAATNPNLITVGSARVCFMLE